MKKMLSIIAALATLGLAAPVAAQSWGKGSGAVKANELAPVMSSDEAYSERYTFAVDLDGGGHIGVDFTISNLGFGDGHGAVAVRVTGRGKKYSFKKKLDKDEWSAGKNGFSLNFGNTSVKAKGKTFNLVHNGTRKFDLTFDNKIPMWKPGSGKIAVDGGYYEFDLIAPRADVTGTLDGKAVKGTRNGYADHVATNVAPFDLAKRFSRFRHYNKDIFVMWREIGLTEEHGGKSLTWVVVGYKNAIVFSDANATLKEGRVSKDAKTGYSVPRLLQLDARSGKDSIRLQMRGTKLTKRDLLASYGTAAKMVASAVSEPYQFNLKGKYTLQMTIGGASASVEGRSHYTIDYLND